MWSCGQEMEGENEAKNWKKSKKITWESKNDHVIVNLSKQRDCKRICNSLGKFNFLRNLSKQESWNFCHFEF